MIPSKLFAVSPHFTAEQKEQFKEPFQIVNDSFRPEIGSIITHKKLSRDMTWIVSDSRYAYNGNLVDCIITVTGLKTTGEINEPL